MAIVPLRQRGRGLGSSMERSQRPVKGGERHQQLPQAATPVSSPAPTVPGPANQGSASTATFALTADGKINKEEVFIVYDGQPRYLIEYSFARVLAAQTLKIASINGLGDTEKLETELEDEIRWEENRNPPSEIIGRFRRRCEEILHSKQVLLVVVVLNVVDTLLVMGELTYDFHHVSHQFIEQKEHTEEFLGLMRGMYHPHLDDLYDVTGSNLTMLFDRFLTSFVFWHAANYTAPALAGDCKELLVNYPYSAGNSSHGTNVLVSLLNFTEKNGPVTVSPMELERVDAAKVAHGLHYASISILSVMVAETLLKIACVGRRFLKKKMQMFDALIILVSFTLDLIFVEGITNLQLQNFVVILSFLLPWRVLRVLNSLIVAVMDQHRFHLKLLYKQKRKITRNYQEATEQLHILEKQVETLKNLCTSKGVKDWEVNKVLGQTLAPTSQGGGLKALSKLVFQAAESFAPLSSSPRMKRDVSSPTVTAETSSAPSLALAFVKWNGDADHGTPNGHVHPLEEVSREEEEGADSHPHPHPNYDVDGAAGAPRGQRKSSSARDDDTSAATISTTSTTTTAPASCSVVVENGPATKGGSRGKGEGRTMPTITTTPSDDSDCSPHDLHIYLPSDNSGDFVVTPDSLDGPLEERDSVTRL